MINIKKIIKKLYLYYQIFDYIINKYIFNFKKIYKFLFIVLI